MKIASLILTCLLACIGSLFAHNLPPGFVIEENVITGLSQPTDIKIAPDGRIFISEKGGTVRIVENGVLLPQPFYTVMTQTPNERGLDGILLDPDFDNNGYVYLFYTLPFNARNIVARVTAQGNSVISGSEIELIRFDDMYGAWHNGGGMVFDTTGKLIIGTGDGNGQQWAPDLTKTLGKIIRINPDGSIPTDNPFYAQGTGNTRAIAAYGARNPYTMARSKISGRIFFNDVGLSSFEEVNEYIPGKNYGWNNVEGPLNGGTPPDVNYEDPIYAYDHNYGCGIVGATFYEPDISVFPPAYFGKYFFMEYCEGKVLCMDPDTYQVTEFASDIADRYNNITTSPDGHLYLINYADGNMARISYQGLNTPPIISVQPQPQAVAVGGDLLFRVDVAGNTLSYEWYSNGTLIQSGGTEYLSYSNLQLSDDQSDIYVKITNPYGSITSDTVILTVVNGREPVIQFQNIQTSYIAGDSLFFSAQVSDPDQTTVPLADWTWTIDFHHDLHNHPGLSPTSGIDGGAFYIETFGEVDTNVFYRVILEVLDSSGLTAIKILNVVPEKVTLQIESEPSGIEIGIDGSKETTPYTLRSARNLSRLLEAPAFYVVGDSLYEFVQWHDGNDTLARRFNAEDSALSLEYQAVQKYHSSVPSEGTRIIYTDTASSQQVYTVRPAYEVKGNWDILNPYPWDVPAFPNDYWSGRWEGSLLVPVSDLYHFYLFHDNRVSLVVGDSILIDRITAASRMQDDTASIWLNGGDSVTVIVEYDHFENQARIELAWSNSYFIRDIVPFSIAGTPVTIPEPKTGRGVFLFPNPTSDEFINLAFTSIYNGPFTIEIFNIKGKAFGIQKGFSSGDTIDDIPLGDFPSGLYFMKLTLKDEIQVLKFIKR